MEVFEYTKMKPELDIRQSDKWAKYLGRMGWESHRTSSGINIYFHRTFLGTIIKIQKPLSVSKKDIKEIEDFCVKLKPLFIKIEPFIGQEIAVLEECGYVKSEVALTPPSTIYIDLTKSENELWESISHSGKYSIKRAQREGTVTRFYQNPIKDKMGAYFEMVQVTGKRKHFYVQPMVDFEEKVKIFGKECHLVLSYDTEGKLLSGKFYLCHRDMVLYSTGGTSEKGLKTKAGYELLWKSILYFKGLGYKVLDLEGRDDPRFKDATKNWGGFSHFKEKFGGENIEFPHPYIKYFNPVLKFFSKFMKLPL
ncbi:MAG TPA: peptidoglycan bridge formation glycyltransferase FemA/FemB family protein [Patescibacteria group bacterium]|nr:peptidoglycan bridge formation glycyltransferase FemA/FemB family protein [bacterium]HRY56627.1 peptidoglycan bridge formation glycyltransferase FemA/FemB family protein [Patescibacteria group bacterium]